MIPISILLIVLAQADNNLDFAVSRNPNQPDGVGRNPNQQGGRNPDQQGGFGRFYNSSSQSLFLAKVNDRHVAIVSSRIGGQSAAILRVSNTPQLRLGVEWARNQSFVDGATDKKGKRYGPHSSHSIRFIGMYEINETIKTLTPAAGNYFFSNMTWSPFTTTTTSDADGTNTINLNTFATSGLVTFNFSIHVSDTSKSGKNPFGIKYDVEITGSPDYNLDNSHYRLINLVYSSKMASRSVNATAITFGSQSYDWVPTVLVDGVEKNLTFSGIIDGIPSTSENAWDSVPKGNDHISSLDNAESKVVLGFDIPKFTSSFSWDPTIMIDDSKAMDEYPESSGSTRIGMGIKVFAVLVALML
jgi:hypothetical protein